MYKVFRPWKEGRNGGRERGRKTISPEDFSELKRPIFLKKIKSSLYVDDENPVVEI